MTRYGAIALAALLAGCAMQEPPIVKGPMTARPVPQPHSLSGGSIFQVASYRPLFEDRMPSLIGDTLTVVIQERSATSATEKVNESRKSNMTDSVTPGVNLPFVPSSVEKKLGKISLSANDSATHSATGSNQVSTAFVSSISVTVIDVLPNNNLVVSGEKMVRINNDTESIRLSGIVNPRDVGPNRSVSSLKLADARIEQQTKGTNRLYNDPGWLTKIFLSIKPF